MWPAPNALDRADAQLNLREDGRGQRLELFREDAGGLLGLVDVDVIPLALAEVGQILEQRGLPVQADPNERQVDFLSRSLAGQVAAMALTGGLAVGQDHDL